MSFDSDWVSEAVFSPSKARQQLAEAKDWQYVDTWLFARYGSKQPPPYERNGDTLKVFLALAAHNEAADEENQLLFRLKERTVEELKAEAEADVDADILTALGETLSRDGQESLKSIAALSVALGSPSTDPQRLGADIVELTKSEFDAQQQARRITDLQERLDGELSKLRYMLSEVQHEAFTTPPSFPHKTAEWTRGTKLLSAKLVDYRERLSSAPYAAEPTPSIQKVVTQEQDTLSLKARVKDVEAEVRGFYGLPYNKELALLEVERVKRDLEALKRSRDSLFEGLVEQGGLGGELGDRDGLD